MRLLARNAKRVCGLGKLEADQIKRIFTWVMVKLTPHWKNFYLAMKGINWCLKTKYSLMDILKQIMGKNNGKYRNVQIVVGVGRKLRGLYRRLKCTLNY